MKKIYFLLLISILAINTAQTQSWVLQNSGLTTSLNGIFFTDVNTGYIAGSSGKILKTTNGGTDWTSLTSGTTAQLNAVFFTSSSTGYVVGANGLIRKTTNSGTNWSAQTSNTTQYLYGVYFTDANNGWAVGYGGTVVHTSDGGTNWAVQTTPASGTTYLYSVFFTSNTTGYAVGGSGTTNVVLKTTNGGTNWSQQTCGATNILKSVYFVGVDTGYVAGNGGLIYKTTDGGTNWIAQNSGTTYNIQSLFFPSPVDTIGYAVCNSGYANKTKNGGTLWSPSSTSVTGQNLLSTYFPTLNTGYACGASGTIIKTTTGGEACTITANAGLDQNICNGNSATLTASGGISYAWNTGSNTASITVSPTTNTTYTVTATSLNGCTDLDNVTVTVSTGAAASVSITDNPTGAICAGTSVTFTASPTNGGTTPSYQWKLGGSNISGATSSIYTTTALASGDAITCVMTSSQACATGSPATSNSIAKTVNPNLPASITISANPSGNVCIGTNVNFTAAATNGGSAPAYQWKKNGSNITGATLSTYSSTSLADGDIITCTLTSSEICPVVNIATSNSITMTILSNLTASVSIAASPGITICEGTTVTFTATPLSGGTPTYQWKLNGVDIIGETNSTYTSSTLTNNDDIKCIMTSSLTCATGSPAESNNITMTVNTNVAAGISITADTGTNICAGSTVTFTATPSNGGALPVYQWKNDGANITGATNSTYSTSSLTNGDAITCEMISNATCVTGSPALSNTLSMIVDPVLTASISISSSDTNICSGTNVIFTAVPVNEGTSPSYQWQSNGSDISGATASTYSSSSLTNGESIRCVLTSSVTCISGSPATSASINMIVYTATANAGMDTIICYGENATLTANGGDSYTWDTGVNTQSINVSPTISTTYSVTVNDAGCTASDEVFVEVTNVSADAGSDLYICIGDSVVLSATGGTIYEWSDGVLNGEAFIPDSTSTYTVTVTNANGCSATDDILVTVSPIPATPVITLDGNILTSNADSMNQWYLNDTLIDGATDTSFTITENGSYYVIVTVNGCSSDTSNIISTSIGISEIHADIDFDIYPNPASDKILITISEKSKLEILNINGQIVVSMNTAMKNATLNISDFADGLYFIRIINTKGIAVKKFIKE